MIRNLIGGIGEFFAWAVLAVGGACMFLYVLKFLFQVLAPYQTVTHCVVSFIDGSVTQATSCTKWRDDTSLECGNGKKYSIYAIKSWECKL